jgi:hypothetical protein
MTQIAILIPYEEPRKADNIPVYVPPPTFWESSAKILGAPFQVPSSDSTSSISTYAQAPSSREETKEQVTIVLRQIKLEPVRKVLVSAVAKFSRPAIF